MMKKKLLMLIVVAAVGAVVTKKLRRQPDASVAAPAALPVRVAAETLEVRTELPPEPEVQPLPAPQPEPTEERHALRPSPVPRERPVWSPPVKESSTGKHAAHERDSEDEPDADG